MFIQYTLIECVLTVHHLGIEKGHDWRFGFVFYIQSREEPKSWFLMERLKLHFQSPTIHDLVWKTWNSYQKIGIYLGIRWFCCCWLFVYCYNILPLWESVIVLCFVVRCFVSVLVLQSSWWGRESWLLCLIYLPGVSWWLSSSSSRCHRVVCGLWLWFFLIILTY